MKHYKVAAIRQAVHKSYSDILSDLYFIKFCY